LSVPCRWNSEEGLLPLDPDFSLGRSTRPDAISADGTAVSGTYRFARGASKPFIWTLSEGFFDLVRYVSPLRFPEINRWRLKDLTALSGDGTVVAGFGFNPQGIREGWVIILGDRCGGDFDGDGVVSARDQELFYRSWEEGLGAADLNRDGGIDGQDVECFWWTTSEDSGRYSPNDTLAPGNPHGFDFRRAGPVRKLTVR